MHHFSPTNCAFDVDTLINSVRFDLHLRMHNFRKLCTFSRDKLCVSTDYSRVIAQEKEVPSAQNITPFTSLHGYPEVAENIRQLLIAQEYPDRYLDYVLCRGKKLDKSWEACAQKLGINVARIQALFDVPEAEQLFRENIRRAAELGIKASPTILVDNHQLQTRQLLRASGTPCQ